MNRWTLSVLLSLLNKLNLWGPHILQLLLSVWNELNENKISSRTYFVRELSCSSESNLWVWSKWARSWTLTACVFFWNVSLYVWVLRVCVFVCKQCIHLCALASIKLCTGVCLVPTCALSWLQGCRHVCGCLSWFRDLCF